MQNFTPLVILAPMSGVTDKPFRDIVRKYGHPHFVVSEMIASQSMVRYIRKSLLRSCQEDEPSTVVQLAGCDPDIMAEAARINVDRGATCIDINMGCPAKKIAVNSYAGAALMRDEDLAKRIIAAVVAAVPVDVTVKMRKGWDHHSENAIRLSNIAADLGVKRVAIHGRTRCQLYDGKADWDFLAKACQQIRLPVIGNGDITTEDHAHEALLQTKAAGVMVGRGCYGRPWLLKQIRHYLETGVKLPSPSFSQQQDIALEHIQAILSYYGNQTGLPLARKHLGWYTRGLPHGACFRTLLFSLTDGVLMEKEVRNFYKVLQDTSSSCSKESSMEFSEEKPLTDKSSTERLSLAGFSAEKGDLSSVPQGSSCLKPFHGEGSSL